MKAKEIMGGGCGGLDGDKCLENGTNKRSSADVSKINHGSNIGKQISEKIRRIVYTQTPCFRCRHFSWHSITPYLSIRLIASSFSAVVGYRITLSVANVNLLISVVDGPSCRARVPGWSKHKKLVDVTMSCCHSRHAYSRVFLQISTSNRNIFSIFCIRLNNVD